MMETKVFSVKGEEIKSITLNDDVFGTEVSEGSIYYAINNELANRRVGTASTKTRGEVRGSNAKPWR
jgi:large subunit ribosomal protein L4